MPPVPPPRILPWLVLGTFALACGPEGLEASATGDTRAGPEESRGESGGGADGGVDAGSAPAAASPDAGARDAGAVDAGTPFPPAGTRCEYGFFRKYFDRDNTPAQGLLRDAAFLHIVSRHDALLACGAKTTLGGMLSLMIYEGGGAKVAFYNDRCAENSYDNSATCWTNPSARYSYQFGLAPVHTSNFHPCADVGWTSKMRARLDAALGAAGFSPSAQDIASVASALHTFCPNAAPTRVDFYILSVHSRFQVPTNGSGNDLPHAGAFPFFTPRVVIDLFFDALQGSCASLGSDAAAIGVFGGADTSYRSATKQQQILALWNGYRAANCP